jgi:hypothetical protein
VKSTVTARPDATEYAPPFAGYVGLVPDGDVVTILERQLDELLALLRPASEEAGNTRHAPYTWSVKEVVGHVTDAERVFGYRALCVARGDQTPLPGFDENAYVPPAAFDACRLADLVAQFEHLRRSHLYLVRSLPADAWVRRGVANNSPVSTRALAYIMAGHAEHHARILRKRLGQGGGK